MTDHSVGLLEVDDLQYDEAAVAAAQLALEHAAVLRHHVVDRHVAVLLHHALVFHHVTEHQRLWRLDSLTCYSLILISPKNVAIIQ